LWQLFEQNTVQLRRWRKLVGKKLDENYYGRFSVSVEDYRNDAAIYSKILEHKPCQQCAFMAYCGKDSDAR